MSPGKALAIAGYYSNADQDSLVIGPEYGIPHPACPEGS